MDRIIFNKEKIRLTFRIKNRNIYVHVHFSRYLNEEKRNPFMQPILLSIDLSISPFLSTLSTHFLSLKTKYIHANVVMKCEV